MKALYLIILTSLIFSCSPNNKNEQTTATENIDNVLVEKANRKIYLRHGANIIKSLWVETLSAQK